MVGIGFFADTRTRGLLRSGPCCAAGAAFGELVANGEAAASADAAARARVRAPAECPAPGWAAEAGVPGGVPAPLCCPACIAAAAPSCPPAALTPKLPVPCRPGLTVGDGGWTAVACCRGAKVRPCRLLEALCCMLWRRAAAAAAAAATADCDGVRSEPTGVAGSASHTWLSAAADPAPGVCSRGSLRAAGLAWTDGSRLAAPHVTSTSSWNVTDRLTCVDPCADVSMPMLMLMPPVTGIQWTGAPPLD